MITCLFVLTAKGHLQIIDTDYSVKTAISLLENGNMRIKPTDDNYLQFTVKPTKEGLIYSQYGIGLPIIFLPFIFISKCVSAFTDIPQDTIMSFLLSFYNIPFALLGLWFIREILLKFGIVRKQADATIVIISICTAYWHYSVTDFSEATQLALLLGSVNAAISKDEKKWRHFSISFSLLLSIKIAYLILLPLFFIYGLIDSRKRKHRLFKDIINGASFLIPLGIIIGILNYLRFNNAFEFGYGGHPGLGFSLGDFTVSYSSIFL